MTAFEDVTWLEKAYEIALRSNDLSTQNGAILVPCDNRDVSIEAWNDLPEEIIQLSARQNSPAKYLYTEHAERCAIYGAAKWGFATEGATLYCPWYACSSCARGIIESGISRVVGHKQALDKTPERWKDSIDAAFEMLDEAGVVTDWLDIPKLGVDPIRFNGELWFP